jgi:hypothetical protein
VLQGGSAHDSPVGSAGSVRVSRLAKPVLRKTHSVYIENWKDGEKIYAKAGNLMGSEASQGGSDVREEVREKEEEEEEEEEEEWDYHWNPSREAEEDTLQPKFFKFL